MRRDPDPHIAPRVLALCQEPRTSAEIEAEFRTLDEARRARFAVYNLVRRGLLRNIAEGRHSVRNPGRFVAARPERAAPKGTGSELARAWGLPC